MCGHKKLSMSEEHGAFANSRDFCRIFVRHLNSLYKLAFLLTADHSLAEQCTLATHDQTLTAYGISKAAAKSWIRRALIKNALRIVRRELEVGLQRPEPSKDEFSSPFNAIISLQPMERFVFVLSVLEGISDCACSQLFGCAVPEIGPARVRALESLSTFQNSDKDQLTGRHFSPAVGYKNPSSLGRVQARSGLEALV